MAKPKLKLDSRNYHFDFILYINQFNQGNLENLRAAANSSPVDVVSAYFYILAKLEGAEKKIKDKAALDQLYGEVEPYFAMIFDKRGAVDVSPKVLNIQAAAYLLRAWVNSKRQKGQELEYIIKSDFKQAVEEEKTTNAPFTMGLAHHLRALFTIRKLEAEPQQDIISAIQEDMDNAAQKGFPYRAYVESKVISDWHQKVVQEGPSAKFNGNEADFLREFEFGELFTKEFIAYDAAKNDPNNNHNFNNVVLSRKSWQDYALAMQLFANGYCQAGMNLMQQEEQGEEQEQTQGSEKQTIRSMLSAYLSSDLPELPPSFNQILNFWQDIVNKSWPDLREKIYKAILFYNRYDKGKQLRQMLRNQILATFITIDKSNVSDAEKIQNTKQQLLPLILKSASAELGLLQARASFDGGLSELPKNLLTILVQYDLVKQDDIESINDSDLTGPVKSEPGEYQFEEMVMDQLLGTESSEGGHFNFLVGRKFVLDCIAAVTLKKQKELRACALYKHLEKHITNGWLASQAITNSHEFIAFLTLESCAEREVLADQTDFKLDENDWATDNPREQIMAIGRAAEEKVEKLIQSGVDFEIYLHQIRTQKKNNVILELLNSGYLPNGTVLIDLEKFNLSRKPSFDQKTQTKQQIFGYYWLGLCFFSKGLFHIATYYLVKAWRYALDNNYSYIFVDTEIEQLQRLFLQSDWEELIGALKLGAQAYINKYAKGEVEPRKETKKKKKETTEQKKGDRAAFVESIRLYFDFVNDKGYPEQWRVSYLKQRVLPWILSLGMYKLGTIQKMWIKRGGAINMAQRNLSTSVRSMLKTLVEKLGLTEKDIKQAEQAALDGLVPSFKLAEEDRKLFKDVVQASILYIREVAKDIFKKESELYKACLPYMIQAKLELGEVSVLDQQSANAVTANANNPQETGGTSYSDLTSKLGGGVSMSFGMDPEIQENPEVPEQIRGAGSSPEEGVPELEELRQETERLGL